jgi:hypothetical protein
LARREWEASKQHNLLKLISCLSIGIVIAEIFEQNTQFLPLSHCSPALVTCFSRPIGKDAQGVCVNLVRNDAMHNVTIYHFEWSFATRGKASAIPIFSSFYLERTQCESVESSEKSLQTTECVMNSQVGSDRSRVTRAAGKNVNTCFLKPDFRHHSPALNMSPQTQQKGGRAADMSYDMLIFIIFAVFLVCSRDTRSHEACQT